MRGATVLRLSSVIRFQSSYSGPRASWQVPHRAAIIGPTSSRQVGSCAVAVVASPAGISTAILLLSFARSSLEGGCTLGAKSARHVDHDQRDELAVPTLRAKVGSSRDGVPRGRHHVRLGRTESARTN
jgi:hypothetical protein